jgi:Skp family chaperone for outer membrane proteins
MIRRRIFAALLLALPIAAQASDEHEAEMVAMREEIRELAGKTQEIRKKIEHTKEKAAQDSAGYQKYIAGHRSRIADLAAERDSLKMLVRELESKRDDFEENARSAELSAGNIKAMSSSITALVARNCDLLVDSLAGLDRFNIDRQLSALRFLSGEITAGTVDAIEGMERYYQIVKQLEQQSRAAESWSGPSPSAQMKGEVTFLRLGFVWLACVNSDNTAALFWNVGNASWETVSDQQQILAVRKAIDLVAGKAAPQLIALPFKHPVQSVSTEGADNEK